MEKIYYSISEVADMFNINQSNLRFWEKEFPQLTPKRNAKATRFYTKDDIEVIKKIIYLTEEQHLTLEGAKKRLSEKADKVDKQHKIREKLLAIKAELQGIASEL